MRKATREFNFRNRPLFLHCPLCPKMENGHEPTRIGVHLHLHAVFHSTTSGTSVEVHGEVIHAMYRPEYMHSLKRPLRKSILLTKSRRLRMDERIRRCMHARTHGRYMGPTRIKRLSMSTLNWLRSKSWVTYPSVKTRADPDMGQK